MLASMDKVYYFYKPSREGSFLQEMLHSFSGVLISDFYTAYDSLNCEQQKCLVHFVRDIDEDRAQEPIGHRTERASPKNLDLCCER